MSVEILHEKRNMTAAVTGEIDHHAAADIRVTIDGELERTTPEVLTFDMSGVTFMDSSAIGLVMGRQKLVTELGGRCRVADPPAYILKVMRLSGIEKLCEIVDTRVPLKAAGGRKTAWGGDEQ